MPVAQIFGNLSLWASLPAVVLYYLFYSSFEYDDPEGRVTDTKVNWFVDVLLIQLRSHSAHAQIRNEDSIVHVKLILNSSFMQSNIFILRQKSRY